MANTKAKTNTDSCISNLENHVHDVFASFRISGEDFVYCANSELYGKLDDYCDDLTISEVRPPFLVKGEAGTGKTALLANWLHRRQHASAKSRTNTDEFIFWHAVGCSRQSLSTNYVIKRLISGLKLRFELTRAMPRSQERLSWELPRFLDLASKKGKVIVIIDGIHRLKANDGGEDSLAWLPLELPPNVRMILSATVSKEGEFEAPSSAVSRPGTQHSSPALFIDSPTSKNMEKKSRVLAELERRQVPFMYVPALDKTIRKGIIGAFVQNTINTDAVAIATGPYIGALFDQHGKGTPSSDMVAGFLLFESQIAALLDHKLGGNPWFLRLFMRCLYFVCSRGYSLWQVFNDWIQSSTVEELLDRILTTCESGFHKTRESAQQDSDHTIAAGGTPALRHLYPWHPAFRDRNNLNDDSSSTMMMGVLNTSADKTVQSSDENGEGGNETNEAINKANKSLSNLVRHNLGDQGWVNIERQVHRQLQMAVIEAQKIVEDGWASIKQDGKLQLIEDALEKLNNDDDFNVDENGENRARAFSADGASLSSGSIMVGGEIDGQDSDAEEDSWEDQSMTSITSKRASLEGENSNYRKFLPGSSYMSSHKSGASGSDHHSMPFQPGDPSEGFFSLPVYMRGGVNISGFGDLLGNALGLLYVTRQGLKEQELWKILAYLQYKAKREKELSQEQRNQIKARKFAIKRHVAAIQKVQGYLENAFRAEDIGRTGFINADLMLHWIQKHVQIEDNDFSDIIEYIMNNLVDNNSIADPAERFIEGDSINYDKLFKLLYKVRRRFQFFTKKSAEEDEDDESAWEDEFDDNFDSFSIQIHKDVNGGEHTHKAIDEDGNMQTLGPVVEELLLQVLRSLGVLYSAENKVLILASDSELFRKLIFTRYILPRGGGTVQYWHNLIIQYFRTQPNTLRKCEELPWHLKICRKWTSLKDTLVDLKTFDLMFNNDLRDELMEYWLLLSEGPLYVNDPKVEGDKSLRSSQIWASNKKMLRDKQEDDEDNQTIYSHILRDIDESIALRVPLKTVRRRAHQNQMQPFDVVEELNRSVEAWVTAERPSPYLLYRTINQIALFLLEFAKHVSSPPQFRRIGIAMSVIDQFGVSLSELKDAMALASAFGTAGDGDGSPLRQSQDAKALVSAKSAMETKYFDKTQKDDDSKFPTQQMVVSNFYFYLRWIWIQFPWLALHLAATINAPTKTLLETDEFGNTVGDPTEGIDAAMQEEKNLLRVWNAKKTDPSVPVFTNSMNRKLAAVKPRTSLSSMLERNVSVSCKNLYEELSKPSHIAQVRLGLGGFQRDKFRRTFEEEIELSKSIPFGYHGTRAVKKGSLFPSFEQALREKNMKKMETEVFDDNINEDGGINTRKKKKKTQTKFDVEEALKSGGATFFLTEIDDEIRRITSEEYLQSHRIERSGGSVLIKDEMDLEYDTLLDRIARMKTICNKLLIIQREKSKSIIDLEHQIQRRQESDAILISEVQTGEQLIKSLHERNVAMEKNVKDAVILEEGYRELLKALRLNPPFLESHVKSLELECQIAEKQFDDLCQHRAKLYDESMKLEQVKRQQLLERIQYFQNARQEVAVKKKQVLKDIKHLKDSLGDRHKKYMRKLQLKNALTDNNSISESISQKSSEGSSESGSSDNDSDSEIHLTQPVKHFINALVRKVTYNEPIIKESDATLDDVKQRATGTSGKHAPPQNAPGTAPGTARSVGILKNLVKGRNALRRENTNGASAPAQIVIQHNNNPVDQSMLSGSDADSVSTSSVVRNNRNSMIGQGMMGPNGNGGMMMIGGVPRKKLTIKQISQIRSAVNSLLDDANTGESMASLTAEEKFKMQLQKAVHLIFEQTESNTYEDFIERYLHDQSLLESLTSQQILADSRLSQLRAEHAELAAALSDITFSAEEGGLSNSSASQNANSTNNVEEGHDDNNDRFLDNQLFAKEVRLHHYQRLYDKTVHVISEVRTAIAHVVRLLTINTKLLSGLPRTTPPQLNTNEDMPQCLSWMEDRIIALNEALTMDANRPSNQEENKPIAQRQMELATLVYDMTINNKKRPAAVIKAQRKQQGNMSKVLINPDTATYISSPRGVYVTAASKIDKTYDNKVTKVITERDKRADINENKTPYSRDKKTSDEAQRFLSEGLDRTFTKNMSRQAKQLVNKRSGRTASYGLVLEELMESRGQVFDLMAPKSMKSPNPANASGTTSKMTHKGTDGEGSDTGGSPRLGTASPNKNKTRNHTSSSNHHHEFMDM